jgi:hypothetical protein
VSQRRRGRQFLFYDFFFAFLSFYSARELLFLRARTKRHGETPLNEEKQNNGRKVGKRERGI